MPVHRKRFRIEEAFGGDMPMPAAADGDMGPMYREIMSELRAEAATRSKPRTWAGLVSILAIWTVATLIVIRWWL